MTKRTRKPDAIIGLLTVVVTLVIATNLSTAHSSCLVPDVRQEFEHAKAVFIGEVEEIIPPRSDDAEGEFFDRAYLVKFKIERSWKGTPFGPVTVWALQGDKIFALPPFHKGERYLVYADALGSNEPKNDQLVVNSCNRTALLPLKAKPEKRILLPEVDRQNGANDIAALDSLLILKRR